MKMLFDFFPIILFFAAYMLGPKLGLTTQSEAIYPATAVMILGVVVQVIWLKLKRRKIEPMLMISAGLALVLGGLTLLLHNKNFLFWKPTAIYWVLAFVLSGGRLAGRNYLTLLLGEQLKLPARIWDHVLLLWVGFFTILGGVNLWVAYSFSEQTWVYFKFPGSLVITILFAIAQGLYVGRYAEESTESTKGV